MNQRMIEACEQVVNILRKVEGFSYLAVRLYDSPNEPIDGTVRLSLAVGTEEQRRQHARTLMQALGLQTMQRQADDPTTLTTTFNGLKLEVSNYPSPFKVECKVEKACFAVFDDGRRISVSDVEMAVHT